VLSIWGVILVFSLVEALVIVNKIIEEFLWMLQKINK